MQEGRRIVVEVEVVDLCWEKRRAESSVFMVSAGDIRDENPSIGERF